MKHKYLAVINAALLSAASAFCQVTLNTAPSRTVGHPATPVVEQNSLYSANPNLVEGRELLQPFGLALDTSSATPAIYVSDTSNNRVLGWKDAVGFRNGAMADVVLGQIDFYTTFREGPTITQSAPGTSGTLQSGLNSPTGLAVRNGDVYVVDSGNNRLLRFPKPFTKTAQIPDLVIGQPSLNTASANYTGAVSEKGVFTASSSSVLSGALAFDADGNLWFTDPGNRRVLQYTAADLAKGGSISASLVLGQADFTSTRTALSTSASLISNQFAVPAAVGFDKQGRLYVADADASSPQNLSRVLVFTPPFRNDQAAARIMGVVVSPTTLTVAQQLATLLNGPSGLFFLDDSSVGVVDSYYSRILIFPPFDQWQPATTLVSPQAKAVFGHNGDFTAIQPNNTPQSQAATYLNPPTATVFSRPMAATLYNGELYIADTYNNRVVVAPVDTSATPPTLGAATRVLGQERLDTGSANYIEGREFQFQNGTLLDAGVAVDYTTDTPHLYVSDPGNNRVLAFRDMRLVKPGMAADLIIGQQNGQTGLCNYPANGDPNAPTAASLCRPAAVLVDSHGDLWVADRGNGRVLRFPAPFSQTGPRQANLVLGQPSFTNARLTDATSSAMSAPYGLAISVNGALLVSDQNHNRVLMFTPNGGDFQNGQAADKVIGQLDFRANGVGTSFGSFSAPHHIALDTDSRLYVTDTGNNRVLIFDSVDKLSATGASAAFRIASLSAPQAVYVSPSTGEIWVGNTQAAQALRFPKYDNLVTTGASTFTLALPSYSLALAQDQFGALVLADATNRIAIYFPQLVATNAASGLTSDNRPLAPGMWVSLWPSSGQFATSTAAFTDLKPIFPMPTTLADTQVLLNNKPVFLSYVSPTQVNALFPMSAPTSGYADVQIIKKSTGQVLGAKTVFMNSVSPGLFLNDPNTTTTRLAAVINHDDGTVNSASNPAKRESYVELYGTGAGVVPGAPDDGNPAPSSPLYRTTNNLRVFVNTDYLDCGGCAQGPGEIQYSGLAPGLAGVWQINIKIPKYVDPTANKPTVVYLLVDSAYSAGLGITGYNTVIYVK
jgi:uncharacterized protein (TIGR03437 family)